MEETFLGLIPTPAPSFLHPLTKNSLLNFNHLPGHPQEDVRQTDISHAWCLALSTQLLSIPIPHTQEGRFRTLPIPFPSWARGKSESHNLQGLMRSIRR